MLFTVSPDFPARGLVKIEDQFGKSWILPKLKSELTKQDIVNRTIYKLYKQAMNVEESHSDPQIMEFAINKDNDIELVESHNRTLKVKESVLERINPNQVKDIWRYRKQLYSIIFEIFQIRLDDTFFRLLDERYILYTDRINEELSRKLTYFLNDPERIMNFIIHCKVFIKDMRSYIKIFLSNRDQIDWTKFDEIQVKKELYDNIVTFVISDYVDIMKKNYQLENSEILSIIQPEISIYTKLAKKGNYGSEVSSKIYNTLELNCSIRNKSLGKIDCSSKENLKEDITIITNLLKCKERLDYYNQILLKQSNRYSVGEESEYYSNKNNYSKVIDYEIFPKSNKMVISVNDSIRGNINKLEIDKDVKSDDILFVVDLKPKLLDRLFSCKGIIARRGGLLSHVAIICRELGIPCIIGVGNEFDHIEDGSYVEIDSEGNLIS